MLIAFLAARFSPEYVDQYFRTIFVPGFTLPQREAGCQGKGCWRFNSTAFVG
jgi:hypothetical protein